MLKNVNPNDYFTMDDLKACLDVSNDILWRYCREGLIYCKLGNNRYFKGSDVIDFFDRHRETEVSA